LSRAPDVVREFTPVSTVPKRPLAVTSPYLEGDDVRALQVAVNAFRTRHSLQPIEEDGVYGPLSHEATYGAAWYLGIGRERLSSKAVTIETQLLILDPGLRTPRQMELGRRRLEELPAPTRGASAAVAFAVGHIGHEEDYPFRDRSSLIDEWGAAYGSPQKPGQVGWQWCGIFVAACLRAAGLHVPKGILWTPTGFSWGQQGTNGFERRIYRPSEARTGDLVYFDWPHKGYDVDHVGIVRKNLGNGTLLTIEGNTHPEKPPIKGSDYGVFQRHRSADIKGCTRPRYPA
jgi:hypothetical protein